MFFTPLSYTGWGSLEQLLPEVEKHSPERILVVTDPVLNEIGLVDRVRLPLEDAGYSVDIYTDTEPEPPLAIGEKLVNYTRENKYSLVIGLVEEVP